MDMMMFDKNSVYLGMILAVMIYYTVRGLKADIDKKQTEHKRAKEQKKQQKVRNNQKQTTNA